MVNTNIITEGMYHKVRGIIRGELAHFTCGHCKRNDAEHYPCDCCMMYDTLEFKPTEKYISSIARKICDTIGEPLNEWDYEEWE